MKTAILYGSSLGNTQFVASKIQKHFPDAFLSSVFGLDPATLQEFDLIVMGSSTWGVGNMQDDFELFTEKLKLHPFPCTTFALFGLGDQQNYPDTFCDGMGRLYEILQHMQATVIGESNADDYDFSESKAFRNGQFIGLALDEENEPDLTDVRILNWVKQLRTQLVAPE